MPRVLSPRWSNYLSRIYDRRAGSPVQLLDDVLPVAPVHDAARFDNFQRRGEVPWSIGVTLAAGGAGQKSAFYISGRAGWITVVESIFATSTAPGRFSWLLGLSPSGGFIGTACNRLDMRGQTTPSACLAPGAQYLAQNQNVAWTRLVHMSALCDGMTFIPFQCVLDATSDLLVEQQTANQAGTFYARGFDVPIENTIDAGA